MWKKLKGPRATLDPQHRARASTRAQLLAKSQNAEVTKRALETDHGKSTSVGMNICRCEKEHGEAKQIQNNSKRKKTEYAEKYRKTTWSKMARYIAQSKKYKTLHTTKRQASHKHR